MAHHHVLVAHSFGRKVSLNNNTVKKNAPAMAEITGVSTFQVLGFEIEEKREPLFNKQAVKKNLYRQVQSLQSLQCLKRAIKRPQNYPCLPLIIDGSIKRAVLRPRRCHVAQNKWEIFMLYSIILFFYLYFCLDFYTSSRVALFLHSNSHSLPQIILLPRKRKTQLSQLNLDLWNCHLSSI
jgi:hypothetical protein